MANNRYNDKEGRYPVKPVTIETVDGAVFDFFDKKLDIKVDSPSGRKKVNTIFTGGERWAMVRQNGFRDKDGTLILPVVSVRRRDIIRNSTLGGMTSGQKSITVSKRVHPKTSNIQNLVNDRRSRGLFHNPKKKEPIFEVLTIPFPDFCDVEYKITIWAQHNTQMNEILENIVYNFVNAGRVDSFVMPVEYDGKEPKGDSYYFVGFVRGVFGKQSNDEEFTGNERIIKYSFDIKVPAYFILDPKTEALSYGEDEDRNKVVYKKQTANKIKLKEEVLTLEQFQELYG